MTELTTTSYLILGLLTNRERSAYEIAEQMGRGVTEVWPRAGRQLYDAPKPLVQAGLIEARKEPTTGRRERTVYSITPAGRAALREWLATRPAPPALAFEGMVHVLFADHGSLDDLRATLVDIAARADEVRELFEAHARFMLENDGGTFREKEHLFALSNAFVVGHFAHIESWAEWALAETETWADTVTPAETHREQTRAILARSARMKAPRKAAPKKRAAS